MKASAELWVRLKVIDLVTQTAWMTLTEKLAFAGTLRGLVHYSFWGFSAEGDSLEGMGREIDRVIRVDSAFTNQNKHVYRLNVRAEDGIGAAGSSGAPGSARAAVASGTLQLDADYPIRGKAGGGAEGPKRPPSAGEGVTAYDCLVRERRPDRETGYAERLNARLRGATVSSVRAGDLWRIMIAGGDAAAGRAEIERILVTKSRLDGLLLNPHYQTFEIIAEKACGGCERR